MGDPHLKSNLTRRIDFALFMVQALANDELIHKAPAIVGCQPLSIGCCCPSKPGALTCEPIEATRTTPLRIAAGPAFHHNTVSIRCPVFT